MAAERRARVLVVDDHLEMARMLAEQLTDAGHDGRAVNDGAAALSLLESEPFDLVLTDLRMSGIDGLDLLAHVRRTYPDLPVLIMTAFGDVGSAVEAVKAGAAHYFTKPFALAEVLVFVERALADSRLRRDHAHLRRLAVERGSLQAMVGQSSVMRALYDRIERIAATEEVVLVRGESGTGKELVARAIHLLGARKDAPLVSVNCTALPATLLESELFGHVRGAFTGATAARRGLFAEADGGTLFLDEVGDMPVELQAKLLRVIEDGQVRAVGSDLTRRVNVRLIASTHQPLDERVRDGRFRQDLFFRLNVLAVVVPPLRDRREDLPALVDHFLARCRAADPQVVVESFSKEALARLANLPWPGNVRELENLVKRIATFATRPVAGLDELAAELAAAAGAHARLGPEPGGPVELLPLRQVEDAHIAAVLEHCEGNKTRAAQILEVDVSTLHRRERQRGR